MNLRSYMFLVCTFATLLQYPTSPVRHLVPSAIVRRALMGFLVGSAVVAIIHDALGQTVRRSFQPGNDFDFLSTWKAGVLGYVVLCGRAIRGRDRRQ